MSKDKKISIAVIKRLPRYYRYLEELLEKNLTRISSKELSVNMDITASQIRQDLNNFGCFGQQGYGYNVENLYTEIGKILGLKKTYNMILIGFGNVGHALMNYDTFTKRGFSFIGIFDIDSNLIGTKSNNLVVQNIENLESFLYNNEINIAVLALPKENAFQISKVLERHNIKGIWNFSNIDLQLNENIKIENVHLTDSLMTLSYRLNE